jgi:hypothetical protein
MVERDGQLPAIAPPLGNAGVWAPSATHEVAFALVLTGGLSVQMRAS